MIDKSAFLESLPISQKEAGYIKFNIPDENHLDAHYGEGVWGWVTPEEKRKYDDDHYYGKITAILCNNPLRYCDRLPWGTEVVLQCHGYRRPTLDPDWVRENILRNREEMEGTP